MNLVRRAREDDIPALLELLVQVNMVHHTGRPDIFRGPTTKYNREQLLDLLEEENAPIFVCEGEDGTVKGHAFCVLKQFPNHPLLTDNKELYIDDICVREECRGQGVGRTLFQHVKDYARSMGCHNLTLNVWECNPGAKAFYTAMGMVPYKVGMETIL